MDEEKQQNFSGVLLGIVQNEAGESFIGIALGGIKLAMPVEQAGVVFNQLGDLLDELGYFEDEESPTEVPACRLH